MLDIMEHGEFFISLVQQHELLWNKANTHFKAADKKAVAWEQIGASFNLTGQQASQTFVSLRQKYIREKEKESAAIKSGKPLKVPWFLMNFMRFLDAVIAPRKGQPSLFMNNQMSRSRSKSLNEHEDDDIEVLSTFTVSELPFSDSSSFTSPQSETSLSFSFDGLTRNSKIKAIPISALTEAQTQPITMLDSPTSSPTNIMLNQQSINTSILSTSTQTKRLKRKHEEPYIMALIAAIEAPVHVQTLDSAEHWKVKDEVKTFCKYLATRLNKLPDHVRNDFENETLFHLYDVEQQSSRK